MWTVARGSGRPARTGIPLLGLAAVVMAGCSESAPADRAHDDGAFSRESHQETPHLSGTERAIHLLSRTTYGVRPQDVEMVLTLGEQAWLDWQLQPDGIADEVAEARLAAMRGVHEQPRRPSP
jgi:hypothetical protein